MSCTVRQQTREEMTALGMLDQEIDLLQLEIKKARMIATEKAEQEKQSIFETFKTIEEAETQAREIAHDRFHLRQAEESKNFFDSLKLALHVSKSKVEVS